MPAMSMRVMSRRQYRQALDRYGLTQAEACWLFSGRTQRSGRRWAAQGAPFHVALLITLMDEGVITLEDITTYGTYWRGRKLP
jgi:hypothetical protein